ncbi:MAG TPA: polysaccharide deacetylase family protein [Acidimicrobiales bacterium]|nr:polysaccharide deacetylase family protein [Acidimicrobiales bacterium]
MTASLLEQLGYRTDARLVIVNADDLGLCHAANVGVYDCLRTGTVTSATLMVPCPWSRDAAARYRGEDVGVHLTVNAEWERYRWGPITHAPSLLDGDGGFPRTIEDFWDHADVDEVRRECRAQIERAILWGFDVSHLDAHMDTLLLRPEFYDVYLELAVDFGLPVRIAGGGNPTRPGFPARDVAEDAGVVFVDRVLSARRLGATESVASRLASLEPGVTELRLHPAVDTPELRTLAGDWEARVDDHRLVCGDGGLAKALDAAGVVLVGYRALRDLVRAGRSSRSG